MPCEKLYTKSKDLTKILKCAKVKIMTKPTRLRPSQGGKFHTPVGPAPEVVAEVRAEDPANRIFRGKDGTIEIGGKWAGQEEMFEHLLTQSMKKYGLQGQRLVDQVREAVAARHLESNLMTAPTPYTRFISCNQPLPLMETKSDMLCSREVGLVRDWRDVKPGDPAIMVFGAYAGTMFIVRIKNLINQGTRQFLEFYIIWREARPRLGECLDYIPGFEVARPSYDCSEKDGVRSALIVRYPPECPKTGQMIRVRFEDGIELLQRFRGWSHYADDAHQFLDFSDRM